jgi:hypothetical protein
MESPGTEPIPAVLPGQLDCCLVCLCAAIGEKHLICKRKPCQFRRKINLGLSIKKIRNMHQGIGLFTHDLREGGVTVAKVADGNPGKEIQIFLSLLIPEPTSSSAHERYGKSGIGSAYVFLTGKLNVLHEKTPIFQALIMPVSL